jgi:hypothetical protein
MLYSARLSVVLDSSRFVTWRKFTNCWNFGLKLSHARRQLLQTDLQLDQLLTLEGVYKHQPIFEFKDCLLPVKVFPKLLYINECLVQGHTCEEDVAVGALSFCNLPPEQQSAAVNVPLYGITLLCPLWQNILLSKSLETVIWHRLFAMNDAWLFWKLGHHLREYMLYCVKILTPSAIDDTMMSRDNRACFRVAHVLETTKTLSWLMTSLFEQGRARGNRRKQAHLFDWWGRTLWGFQRGCKLRSSILRIVEGSSWVTRGGFFPV